MLFSATQERKVQKLAKLSLKAILCLSHNRFTFIGRPTLCWRQWWRCECNCRSSRAGLCRMCYNQNVVWLKSFLDLSCRETLFVALHVFEEKSQEKGDGVHELMQQCQIPRWAPQLHRYSCSRHSRRCNVLDIESNQSQGKQKQSKRTTTFYEFCNAEHGILICTDGVFSPGRFQIISN